MKRTIASVILVASLASTGYALAQDAEQIDSPEVAEEMQKPGKRFNRAPIDLATFSKLDDLKAADTNGDGTLDREEIEAHALKQMVKRMADRMERRLDINGDGTVTLDEIEKQKAKEFAVLDRNDDGKLDRKEMRAAHKADHKGGKHGQRGGGHGFHHKMQR
ncbi:EF-hand domain-containing protein [Aquamicrobium segne]|uniref:EF-hand domain-containing protein n=1 Tax=Aquamicrobium segne TaxID=469547 RepID=A0ABW0GX00_9HYPH